MNETQEKVLPNYPAYVVFILTFIPLVMLELNPEVSVDSGFYSSLKDNFGTFLLFQFILLVLTSAKAIVQYDKIFGVHRQATVLATTFFTFSWGLLLGGYLGYFNAGLNIFLWLTT